MSERRKRVRIIGIGAGHPDQLTVEAVQALRDVDYFIVADKARQPGRDGVDGLVRAREQLLTRHVGADWRVVAVADPERDRDPADYDRAVADWHEARAAAYERVLLEEPGDAGFLVWGDPAFYDSTIRIVERVLARGNVAFYWDVLPGISSLQLLAARHRIVLHEVGQPIHVTTGRRLREAVAAGESNLLVMLNAGMDLADLPGDWHLWWGANLGTADERLVAGELRASLAAVGEARDEAKRAAGWVMDVFLLRRA